MSSTSPVRVVSMVSMPFSSVNRCQARIVSCYTTVTQTIAILCNDDYAPIAAKLVRQIRWRCVRGQCIAGDPDRLVDLGPLGVQRLLVLAQCGGRARLRRRSTGGIEAPDVQFHPLGQRERPGNQVVDGGLQVERGQRLRDLVLDEVFE